MIGRYLNLFEDQYEDCLTKKFYGEHASFLTVVKRRREFIAERKLTLSAIETSLMTGVFLSSSDNFEAIRDQEYAFKTSRPVKSRDDNWWKDQWHNRTDDEWKLMFHVSKSTFVWICNELRDFQDLKKVDTNWHKAVPLEKRIGATLFKLAQNKKHRFIGQNFGIGVSTVLMIIRSVCNAIIVHFSGRYLPGRLPGQTIIRNRINLTPELGNVVDEFNRKFGLPMATGIIVNEKFYFKHINAEQHVARNIFINSLEFNKLNSNDQLDWIRKRYTSNSNNGYAFTAQFIMDGSGRFWSIYPEGGANATSLELLNESQLIEQAERGELFPTDFHQEVTMNDQIIPNILKPYLISDNSYPLCSWIQSYSVDSRNKINNVELNESLFNERIYNCIDYGRNVIKKLKKRFDCLTQSSTDNPEKYDWRMDYAMVVLYTCCILHNICDCRSDHYTPLSISSNNHQIMRNESSNRNVAMSKEFDSISHLDDNEDAIHTSEKIGKIPVTNWNLEINRIQGKKKQELIMNILTFENVMHPQRNNTIGTMSSTTSTNYYSQT
ncbi:hypothetical protein SNEBB_010653 [Seison nebaliae]|nr:hypothetical protein SNEBB_010653 [Seison nebaliae]